MLRPNRLEIFYVIALFAFFLTGCIHHVEPVHRVELKQSKIQRLLVKNETGEEIFILPAKDAEDAAPLSLPVNGSGQILFSLVELADLEKSKFGWYKIIEGSQQATLIRTDSTERYMDMEGIEALLRVKTTSGEKWNFLLSLEGCQMDSTTEEHILSIKEPPAAGNPMDLCE